MIVKEDGYYTGNNYLNTEQMQVNASYIYNYFKDKGWSINAIAGMLGNMESESTINPGIWQNLDQTNSSGGYGLVQWTPATKYLDWCFENSLNSRYMDSNLARIEYEIENNLQWIATSSYPLSFKEFTTSTRSPKWLASAFLKNYERAGVEVELERQANANKWYTYLTGETPPGDGEGGDSPGGTTQPRKRKGFNFVLFNRNRRIYG